jgi:transcriptional regulator with XRE-family HTH domain
MTQVDAANQMGVQQSFISKCESGERRVDIVEVQLFASIYDKPLTYFIS